MFASKPTANREPIFYHFLPNLENKNVPRQRAMSIAAAHFSNSAVHLSSVQLSSVRTGQKWRKESEERSEYFQWHQYYYLLRDILSVPTAPFPLQKSDKDRLSIIKDILHMRSFGSQHSGVQNSFGGLHSDWESTSLRFNSGGLVKRDEKTAWVILNWWRYLLLVSRVCSSNQGC